MSETRQRYRAEIEAAIEGAEGSGSRAQVGAADGAGIYAYPLREGRIAWGVNAPDTGWNILRGVRETNGRDTGLSDSQEAQGSDAGRAHRPAGRCARQPQAPRPQDSSTAVHFRENAVHFHEHAHLEIYKMTQGRIAAVIQLDDHTFAEKQTFGADVSQMTRAGLTFEDVQASPDFTIMAKHRLKRVEQDLYGKFAALLGDAA